MGRTGRRLSNKPMDTAQDPFSRANSLLRKALCTTWQRQQVKQRILRSQVGFFTPTASRPEVCQGCHNYHGIAYGYRADRRTMLICAIHPYGWQGKGSCPDWLGSEESAYQSSVSGSSLTVQSSSTQTF